MRTGRPLPRAWSRALSIARRSTLRPPSPSAGRTDSRARSSVPTRPASRARTRRPTSLPTGCSPRRSDGTTPRRPDDDAPDDVPDTARRRGATGRPRRVSRLDPIDGADPASGRRPRRRRRRAVAQARRPRRAVRPQDDAGPRWWSWSVIMLVMAFLGGVDRSLHHRGVVGVHRIQGLARDRRQPRGAGRQVRQSRFGGCQFACRHRSIFPAGHQRRRRCDGAFQPRAGRPEAPAARHSAARRFEVRCIQPAGLPGDGERRRVSTKRNFTTWRSSRFAIRSRW